MRYFRIVLILTLLSFLTAGLMAAESDYKKYTRPSNEKVLAELTVSPETWTFSVFAEEVEKVYSVPSSEVSRDGDRILCGREIVLSDEGLDFPGLIIDADDIKRVEIKQGAVSSETVLTFITVDEEESAYRRKSSDRISFFGKTVVEVDEFVRGSVISFFGDITVYGEVNEDVVAVLGDVYVGNEAVVRGDVIAVNGEVDLADKASIYGIIRSSEGKMATRRHRAKRWRDYHHAVSLSGAAHYNRVDGLTLWGGLEYEHADSIIPSFEALIGYGFASERGRYRLGLTQTVLRGKVPVQVGGQLFRELRSDDDKIIGEAENSIFALLFNEDWKDYYESEGAYGFARVEFLKWNRFEVGFLSENQQWFDAHKKLWSLFGAKDFRGNFSSVPYDTLKARRVDFDDKNITSIILDYTFDSRDEKKHPRRGWYGFARYEYSPQRWKGDFDFKRFESRLKRYQPIGRYITLDLSAAYGYAEGDDFPISRMFYMGGLGTLHGYRHKEFIGTEYALFSGEYRFSIPRTEIAPFVHYDVGRVMGQLWTGDDSWKNSIGVGVDFDRSLKIFLSQRLDEKDQDPVFYARFSASIY